MSETEEVSEARRAELVAWVEGLCRAELPVLQRVLDEDEKRRTRMRRNILEEARLQMVAAVQTCLEDGNALRGVTIDPPHVADIDRHHLMLVLNVSAKNDASVQAAGYVKKVYTVLTGGAHALPKDVNYQVELTAHDDSPVGPAWVRITATYEFEHEI